MKYVVPTMALAGVVCFAGADWLQFRGTDQRSVSSETAKVPLRWGKSDVAGEQNIAWKSPLPGRGVSGPIVVQGKVVVTSCSGFNQDRLHVLCYDAASGQQLWERQFWATGRTVCHPTSSVAANTPASDGQRIFAFFSSNDLVCLDLQGNLLWFRGLTLDFPTAANDVGMSSSPLVVGGIVVVQVESKGDSFAAGVDAKTGETRWQVTRDAEMNWVSPTLLRGKTPAEDVVLLQSPKRLTAHEPLTGKQLWSYEAECNPIPSAVGVDGIIYLPSQGLTALRHHPNSASELLWKENQLGPGNSSPVVDRGRIYVLNRSGALTCADATDGKVVWRARLKGPYWATPVLADGHLIVFNQDGHAHVVRLDDKQGEVVAENDLNDQIFGSPAVVGGAIYVRGDRHLFKIAQP